MANPTTNYGWQMPTPTDLVTDLPADFEVFGQAVDTSLLGLKGGTTGQVLSKTSGTDMAFTWATDASGIPATIVDAKGDIIAATGADAVSRLAVGANNTVLTADSTTATGLKWAEAAAFDNYQLLNAGGTALTAAGTITISGISGKNSIIIRIIDASTTATNSLYNLRLNADSGANYAYCGFIADPASQPSANFDFAATFIECGGGGFADATKKASSIIKIDGVGATGLKWLNIVTGPNTGRAVNYSGTYIGSSAITSVSLVVATGGANFDAGTIFVYGA